VDFYPRFVFPRLCDCLMGLPALAEQRKVIPADVGGDILEIGFGTGLNLAHHPHHVRRIATVDPNPGMVKLATRRIVRSGIEVDQRASGGEALPFGEETFDGVVSTWTMCRIPEVGRALGRAAGWMLREVGKRDLATLEGFPSRGTTGRCPGRCCGTPSRSSRRTSDRVISRGPTPEAGRLAPVPRGSRT